jgi:acetylornithine deacetylase/succinyl-diaminopimelate desuccinylase-like protein
MIRWYQWPPLYPFTPSERRFTIDKPGYTRAVELITDVLTDHGYDVNEVPMGPDPFNTILGINAPDGTPISLSMNITP